MSAKAAGQAFLEQLLSHVPEEKRAAALEALGGSETALTELGAATLRQSDYSRSMNDLREKEARAAAYYQELTEWHAAQLAAQPTQPAQPATPAPATPASPIQSPGNVLTREDLLTELAQREQAAISAIVVTNELSARHFATFKEPLNIQALMADPDISKLGLPGVYDKHYKPKYDEIRQKAEEARIEAEVQKRLAESRRAPMPYPTGGREPSPLDVIEQAIANPADPTKPVTAPVSSQSVIDAAVAAYESAQARHFGQPTV